MAEADFLPKFHDARAVLSMRGERDTKPENARPVPVLEAEHDARLAAEREEFELSGLPER